MRTKFIELIFPDGTKWRVAAYPVAVERAYFWVDDSNDHPDYENAINDEIDYALCPEGFNDLIHFMENLMDWEELEKKQLPQLPVKPSYDEWLSSGVFASKPVIEND